MKYNQFLTDYKRRQLREEFRLNPTFSEEDKQKYKTDKAKLEQELLYANEQRKYEIYRHLDDLRWYVKVRLKAARDHDLLSPEEKAAWEAERETKPAKPTESEAEAEARRKAARAETAAKYYRENKEEIDRKRRVISAQRKTANQAKRAAIKKARLAAERLARYANETPEQERTRKERANEIAKAYYQKKKAAEAEEVRIFRQLEFEAKQRYEKEQQQQQEQ